MGFYHYHEKKTDFAFLVFKEFNINVLQQFPKKNHYFFVPKSLKSIYELFYTP